MKTSHAIVVALAAVGFTLACASSAFAQTNADEVKRLRAETRAMQQQIKELRAMKQVEQARAQHAKTAHTLRVLQERNK
jgi:phage shock protein A